MCDTFPGAHTASMRHCARASCPRSTAHNQPPVALPIACILHLLLCYLPSVTHPCTSHCFFFPPILAGLPDTSHVIDATVSNVAATVIGSASTT